MPTNSERRARAKRNLDQQVEQRAKEAKQRRLLIVGAAVAAVVLAIGATTTVVMYGNHSSDTAATDGEAASTAQPGEAGQLPKFVASPTLGADCQYPKSQRPASKQVEPPRTGKVPTEPAQVSVSMLTDQGPIGLLLDNAKSPCTVNSFVSLGNKDFFNDTFCHRLTTSPSLKVLQCGDPDGDGTGGPGYEFANEYPTDQYPPKDPAASEYVTYPRGTVAMANAGPGTNGSQFFLVYADSELPPQYTVFGTIQDDGLTTLDKIAKAGVAPGGNGPSDGPPVLKVKIKSVRTD